MIEDHLTMIIRDLFLYSTLLASILSSINAIGTSFNCGECGDIKCPIGLYNSIAPILFIINGISFAIALTSGVYLIYRGLA